MYGVEVGDFLCGGVWFLLVVPYCGYCGGLKVDGHRLLWFWVLLVSLTLRSFGELRVEV